MGPASIPTDGGMHLPYTLVEYARHVLGIQDAEHEETAPDASRLVISTLACSLVGVTQQVYLTPGTLAHQVYGQEAVVEQFRCHYGLNPAYREQFSQGERKVAGVDRDGEIRVVELSNHRFFLATLFVPQLSSRFGSCSMVPRLTL